jgi:hypothetical protein
MYICKIDFFVKKKLFLRKPTFKQDIIKLEASTDLRHSNQEISCIQVSEDKKLLVAGI